MSVDNSCWHQRKYANDMAWINQKATPQIEQRSEPHLPLQNQTGLFVKRSIIHLRRMQCVCVTNVVTQQQASTLKIWYRGRSIKKHKKKGLRVEWGWNSSKICFNKNVWKMCCGVSFAPNSVSLPRRLLSHYTTCLPFEERLNYLLMVRVFTERGGLLEGEWRRWAMCCWSKGSKRSVFCVYPSACLKTTCDCDSCQPLIKIPRRTSRAFSLLQLQLYLFISLTSPFHPFRPPSTSHWSLTLSFPQPPSVPYTTIQFKYSTPHMSP